MTASDNEFTAHVRAATLAAIADADATVQESADRAVVLSEVIRARLRVALSRGELDPERDSARRGSESDSRVERRSIASIDPGDLLAKLSSTMKIDRDVADLIYNVRDGSLEVVVSARRLAEDKAGGSRQLAQIVAAGRQAAGLEEWTPIDLIRKVVADYGRLDSGNFATYMQRLDQDNVCLLRGQGRNRELKVTRGGMEVIAELVKSLAGSA